MEYFMHNLTKWELTKIVFFLITAPIWLTIEWVHRMWVRARSRQQCRGPRLWVPLLLIVGLAGCTETAESKVDKAGAELTRALANIDKIGSELAKAEKALAAQKSHYEELKAKLNGLKPSPAPAPSPTPNPVPSPVPSPEPHTPVPSPLPLPTEPDDGRFELAKAVYRIAKEVASPDRSSESQALAAVFESVASQVAAGTLNGTLLDPQWRKISVALSAGNKPIMAKHLAAWKTAAEQLSEAIATKYSEDKLKSNSDWQDLLNEIARGLKAVK